MSFILYYSPPHSVLLLATRLSNKVYGIAMYMKVHDYVVTTYVGIRLLWFRYVN